MPAPDARCDAQRIQATRPVAPILESTAAEFEEACFVRQTDVIFLSRSRCASGS
jgi:hypothetical protein